MSIQQKYAIIVAGGSGKRMGTDIPKQFIEVAGKPVLMHTMQKFYNYDNSIALVLVLPKSQHKYWTDLVDKHNFLLAHTLAKGGVERFYSVLNGLKLIPKNSLVAIHDGVRPLVSGATIAHCFNAAMGFGAAIPVIPAIESIRKVVKNTNKAVSRSNYFMVQTPQVFQSDILLKAYEQEYDCNFTDDASVVEKMGYPINLVEGNVENIKITRPMDLIIAEALLKEL